ncbi:phosphotransferase enzyme family protein [Lentinula edodes]|uniref:Phosphotransferase enzyme family protein n=1 Tax=Lentinula edodes TaxID=5353 RepID=A0A1Q3DV88_LENED|nr:phosphotransferase enzyme family protein [Lentinula edodes]
MSVLMSSALDIVPLVLDEVTVHTDLEPQVYEEWSTTTNKDIPCTSLIENACCLLDGSKSQPIIARARKPFDINNAVLKLHLSDCVVFGDVSLKSLETKELSVTTVVPGLDAMHAYPRLDALAKERSVTSYAQFVPLIAEVIKDPILSRFVLTHQDTRSNNLILEPASGEISGAVDWEYCGCLPAAMAAQYPEWIRPPIDESLQYRNPKDTFLHYTFELKVERERLCDLYEECVKGLDQEFWNCLVLGTRLRDAYTWIALSNGDLDGEAMDRWVTDHLFGSTANHRCT